MIAFWTGGMIAARPTGAMSAAGYSVIAGIEKAPPTGWKIASKEGPNFVRRQLYKLPKRGDVLHGRYIGWRRLRLGYALTKPQANHGCRE